MKNLSAATKLVFSVTGKLAATPLNPAPLPTNDPLNEPECTKLIAFVVSTTLPVPLTGAIPKLPFELPVTIPFSKLSTCNDASCAALPETMTFFQVAIIFLF